MTLNELLKALSTDGVKIRHNGWPKEAYILRKGDFIQDKKGYQFNVILNHADMYELYQEPEPVGLDTNHDKKGGDEKES